VNLRSGLVLNILLNRWINYGDRSDGYDIYDLSMILNSSYSDYN